MSHFAKVENSIVTQVIVAEQDIIDFGLFGDGWVQTSYNGNMRKNYAGVGYTYDSVKDAFIPPQPYASWVLNEETCQWNPPIPYPTDNKQYFWDEELKEWKTLDIST